MRVVFLVPTGIGAEIGGYAGDASVVVQTLASLCDELWTHPNVVNAAGFYTAPPNVKYIEGYYLDQFFMQQLGFRSVLSNRVALVIDRHCEPWLATIQHAVNATCVTAGVQVMGYELTEQPIAIDLQRTQYGYQGTVKRAELLLTPARRAVDHGATALLFLTYMDIIPPGEDDAYLHGHGPDPIGATEAVLSHYLASELHVPLAHSPIFEPHEPEPHYDPRVCAEEIGSTYLPCTLMGLRQAPQIVPYAQSEIHVEQIHAVIAPDTAMGGIPVLAALEQRIPVILVQENQTVLAVTPTTLALNSPHLYVVNNYWEAAGILLALKSGLDPWAMRRPYRNQFSPLR